MIGLSTSQVQDKPHPNTQSLIAVSASVCCSLPLTILRIFCHATATPGVLLLTTWNKPKDPITTVPKRDVFIVLPYLAWVFTVNSSQSSLILYLQFYGCINLKIIFRNTHSINSLFPYKDRLNRPLMNDVVNRNRNKPKDPITTVPKREVFIVLPYLGLQSKFITKQLKSCIYKFYARLY